MPTDGSKRLTAELIASTHLPVISEITVRLTGTSQPGIPGRSPLVR